MTVTTRSLVPQATPHSDTLRLPGDPGRPLTRSRGASRALRLAGAAAIIVWFALPFVPLVLWALAERWSYPAVLPTEWGLGGVVSALAQGGAAAFGNSLLLGIAVAALATPLGALAARVLTRDTSAGWSPGGRASILGRLGRRIATVVLFAPVVLPPFAAVFGINVLLLRAHIPSLVGLVLVLVVIALPYTAFSMRVAYAAYDPGFEEEARILGATRARVLWRVQVPMLAPALARSAFLAFLVGWSDYIVTVVVGGGQLVTLPLVTASAASGLGNDATVAVLALSAVIPPIVLLALVSRAGTSSKGAPA